MSIYFENYLYVLQISKNVNKDPELLKNNFKQVLKKGKQEVITFKIFYLKKVWEETI